MRNLLDDAIHLMTKSTPLADRKSASVEAPCAAAQGYEPVRAEAGAVFASEYAVRSLRHPFSCAIIRTKKSP